MKDINVARVPWSKKLKFEDDLGWFTMFSILLP